jgi:predicted SprT family Zn-dependent metalloprotease
VQHSKEFVQAVIKYTCISLGFKSFYKYVTFSFSKQHRPYFAVALCGKGKIVFTEAAWKVATHREKYELVVHETCHLIAHEIAPEEKEEHGETWRELMSRMGFVPDEYMYINYTPEVERKLFELRCDCSVRTVNKTQLLKIRRVNEICRMCYTNLADCETRRADF